MKPVLTAAAQDPAVPGIRRQDTDQASPREPIPGGSM